MIKLLVDNKEIETKEGLTLLQAALITVSISQTFAF